MQKSMLGKGLDRSFLGWPIIVGQPDVVTICLGQNDGVQDSTAFCSAYLRFIGQLRHVYPNAQLI
jgi:hypothetical protein